MQRARESACVAVSQMYRDDNWQVHRSRLVLHPRPTLLPPEGPYTELTRASSFFSLQ
eukprot:COSAG03_NODE_1596_length_3812_cov_18.509022_4_plen_57_part_00